MTLYPKHDIIVELYEISIETLLFNGDIFKSSFQQDNDFLTISSAKICEREIMLFLTCI